MTIELQRIPRSNTHIHNGTTYNNTNSEYNVLAVDTASGKGLAMLFIDQNGYVKGYLSDSADLKIDIQTPCAANFNANDCSTKVIYTTSNGQTTTLELNGNNFQDTINELPVATVSESAIKDSLLQKLKAGELQINQVGATDGTQILNIKSTNHSSLGGMMIDRKEQHNNNSNNNNEPEFFIADSTLNTDGYQTYMINYPTAGAVNPLTGLFLSSHNATHCEKVLYTFNNGYSDTPDITVTGSIPYITNPSYQDYLQLRSHTNTRPLPQPSYTQAQLESPTNSPSLSNEGSGSESASVTESYTDETSASFTNRLLSASASFDSTQSKSRLSASPTDGSTLSASRLSASNTNPESQTDSRLSASPTDDSTLSASRLSVSKTNPESQTDSRLSASPTDDSTLSASRLSVSKTNPESETDGHLSGSQTEPDSQTASEVTDSKTGSESHTETTPHSKRWSQKITSASRTLVDGSKSVSNSLSGSASKTLSAMSTISLTNIAQKALTTLATLPSPTLPSSTSVSQTFSASQSNSTSLPETDDAHNGTGIGTTEIALIATGCILACGIAIAAGVALKRKFTGMNTTTSRGGDEPNDNDMPLLVLSTTTHDPDKAQTTKRSWSDILLGTKKDPYTSPSIV